MRPDTRNWLESARYDLETARYMLSSGRYLYVVFFCHLTVEKLLKGLVAEVTERPPPRSHDLILLSKKAKADMEPEHYLFISKLNNASIPTRYPSDMQAMLAEYTEQVAASYLRQTEQVAQWLRSLPELKG